MKKILTSSITDSAQLPLLKRTIDHLQEQELENIKSCVYASLGSSSDSVPIILWGCVGTVLSDTLTVTAGAFIYLGEIYQISAQSITKTGANVFTLSLDTTTFQAGEPTIYSDGVTSVNTNQDLKIKLSQGLTGTGICDWDNVIRFNEEYIVFNTTNISNRVFDLSFVNCTLSLYNLTSTRKGNIVTMSGVFNVTATSSTAFIIRADFNTKYIPISNHINSCGVVRDSAGNITNWLMINNTGSIYDIFHTSTNTNGITYSVFFNFSYFAQ